MLRKNSKMLFEQTNRKLCLLVSRHPCLYIRSSPNYAEKEFVDRAWANIARESKDSVDACKDRWRNIRCTYSKLVNGKTPSDKDSADRLQRYYLHNELEFLRPHIAPSMFPNKRKHVNINDKPEHSDSIDDSNDSCTYQVTIHSPKETDSVSNSKAKDIVTTQSLNKKRRRVDLKDPQDQNRSDNFTDHQSRIRNVDFEFLQNLLPDMKTMNAKQKIIFKRKVFEALEEVFSESLDFL